MAITRIFATFEMSDGTELGPVRVLAADKIKVESTCRAQGWDYSDGPRAHTLMGYFAARRQGLTQAKDYPAFMELVEDYSISNGDDDAAEVEGEGDPTPAGTE